MANGIDKFSESAVIDVEGVRTLEKSDADFSIPWIIIFLVAIIAVGIGWGVSKAKKGDGDDANSDAGDK